MFVCLRTEIKSETFIYYEVQYIIVETKEMNQMARKIIYNGKYSEIIEDGKESIICQRIIEVRKNAVKVISGNGKEYFVPLSDKVKKLQINEKDTAEITINGKSWLVTNIFQEKEELDGEELRKQIEKERFDSFCLGGDY